MDRVSFSCSWCKGTGWIVASHKTKPGLFGFKCSCSLGDRYSSKIPVWSSGYSQDFIPDAEGIAPPMVFKREEPKKEVKPIKVDFRAKASGDHDWDDEEVPF